MFYERLNRFPGALFGPRGYVRFDNEHDFLRDPLLSIGEKVNIHTTLSSHPRYRLLENRS